MNAKKVNVKKSVKVRKELIIAKKENNSLIIFYMLYIPFFFNTFASVFVARYSIRLLIS